MFCTDFSYDFPQDLIATSPAKKTEGDSRLLVYSKKSLETENLKFTQLLEQLSNEDVLVVNETFVLPARFKARKKTGGFLEGLFVRAEPPHSLVWLQGRVREGEMIELENGPELQILKRENKTAILQISADDFCQYLNDSGYAALPPYIRKARLQMQSSEEELCDLVFYQSIFASSQGKILRSVAAPTASLHFTKELLEALKSRGVQVLRINLQVGLGTFSPLDESKSIYDQRLHHESFCIETDQWEAIKKAKSQGKRLIAVGTTSLRALEAAIQMNEKDFTEAFAQTDLFIRPGDDFKMVDSLITNFHQPESSLLILIASFLESKESMERHEPVWRKIYSEAIAKKYRLFSYGDAMWIKD